MSVPLPEASVAEEVVGMPSFKFSIGDGVWHVEGARFLVLARRLEETAGGSQNFYLVRQVFPAGTQAGTTEVVIGVAELWVREMELTRSMPGGVSVVGRGM